MPPVLASRKYTLLIGLPLTPPDKTMKKERRQPPASRIRAIKLRSGPRGSSAISNLNGAGINDVAEEKTH